MPGVGAGATADPEASNVPAIVLAAGASSRMGTPKAVLVHDGQRFIDRVVERAGAAGCAPVVVVVGATEFTLPPAAHRIVNADWPKGPLSSLQRGIESLIGPGGALATRCSGAMVCTVNRPRVAISTLRALLDAHHRDSQAIWQPRHEQRSGHPIVWPRDLLETLLNLRADDPTVSARTLLRSSGAAARRRYVVVDDPGTLENIDRPSDLSTLRQGR